MLYIFNLFCIYSQYIFQTVSLILLFLTILQQSSLTWINIISMYLCNKYVLREGWGVWCDISLVKHDLLLNQGVNFVYFYKGCNPTKGCTGLLDIVTESLIGWIFLGLREGHLVSYLAIFVEGLSCRLREHGLGARSAVHLRLAG